MPGAVRRAVKRITPRPESPVPHEAGQRGVLDHTATRKPDNADHAGSAGTPSGSVRASGKTPSVRAGVERGAVLAGVGAAAGLAVGIPRVFGGGGEGFLDDLFTHDGGDGKSGKDKDDGRPDDGGGLFDYAGEALGVNTGFLVLVVGGGVLLYLWRKRNAGAS